MLTTIRPATPSDAPALAEIAARTFADTFGGDNDPEDMALHLAEAYGPRQQLAEIADPAVTTLLAETDGRLSGFAQLRRGPAPPCVRGDDPIEVQRFYVARDWHGRGIAQDLMTRVLADAVRAGGRTLWLGVWERNERAKAFYRKWSFTDVGSHDFMVGRDRQTDRVMVRPIGSPAAVDGQGGQDIRIAGS